MCEKPEAILEIPKMPDNCYQCCIMNNGLSGQECRKITHRSPDLDSNVRPLWCPLKYKDGRNRKVSLKAESMPLDGSLEPCEDFTGYDQVIIEWPDVLDKPYLLRKAIRDIKSQNPDAEIILVVNDDSRLTEFLSDIRGLTFQVSNVASRDAFLRLEQFFSENGYPSGITLRLKNYNPNVAPEHDWRWSEEKASSIKDHLPAANTDIRYFVPNMTPDQKNQGPDVPKGYHIADDYQNGDIVLTMGEHANSHYMIPKGTDVTISDKKAGDNYCSITDTRSKKRIEGCILERPFIIKNMP